MQEVQLIDILLINLRALNLLRAFLGLLRSFGEHFLRLGDFVLEDGDVPLEHLHFKQALLGFIKVDVVVHVVRRVLTLARRQLMIATANR